MRARQSEYAEDRLPGAIKLADAERRRARGVGTDTSRSRPSRRASAVRCWRHATSPPHRAEAMDRPKDWRPLVYCWRAGSAVGRWPRAVGHRLSGAPARRRLPRVPARRDRRTGRTARSTSLPRGLRHHGSGKSGAAAPDGDGQQVLDLELLANHRGSVLGLVPGSRSRGRSSSSRACGTRCAASTGPAGHRREREQEGRRPARAREADRAHARLAVHPLNLSLEAGCSCSSRTTTSSCATPRLLPRLDACACCAATRR